MESEWGNCPKCGTPLEADTVDIGVGMQQCGPRGCPNCHWFEGIDESTWKKKDQGE